MKEPKTLKEAQEFRRAELKALLEQKPEMDKYLEELRRIQEDYQDIVIKILKQQNDD